MNKYRIRFSATFEVEVETIPEHLRDIIASLRVPEDDETKYVSDTFKFKGISQIDENGKVVAKIVI